MIIIPTAGIGVSLAFTNVRIVLRFARLAQVRRPVLNVLLDMALIQAISVLAVAHYLGQVVYNVVRLIVLYVLQLLIMS